MNREEAELLKNRIDLECKWLDLCAMSGGITLGDVDIVKHALKSLVSNMEE